MAGRRATIGPFGLSTVRRISAPLAGAIDVGFALLESLLVVRRADQMMVPAARIIPVEFRLDAGGDDLEFETFILGGIVARDKPVQAKHGFGAFDHKFRAVSSHRCHYFLPCKATIGRNVSTIYQSVYSILLV